ncbi:MAG: hypothetical protein PHS73_01665 [Candidatus Peribacteraceae bacterium]|nr:hypothetical protein [Candidatus Peribacteraceae bacterium]
MKRSVFTALIMSLLLSACGGGGSGSAITCASYWFDSVGACLPEGWRVLDRAALDERGAPEDVIVAFQRDEAVSGQYPTVTITREPLTGSIDSVSYNEATMRSVAVLPGFKELDSRKIQIDEESLLVHVFHAQPVQEEPQRRFSQVSVVHDGNGYSITALTPVSVNNTLEGAVAQILQSVTFKAPQSSAAAE